ncbi:hypothetical protein [Streptomyces chartreusis]|uniref:hypothetical protein n=1 Tax=Streptomyces chartreusis TaxID=1969 RepID=UPI003D72E730
MGEIKVQITRTYTLPQSREGRGRIEVERLTYEEPHWQTPAEWTADVLRDAGCTQHNFGDRYVTEEPKITDFRRGEEMTAIAELDGFTGAQARETFEALST